MADLKISQLTGATTPLAGTEVLPIVQSGATKQVSVANLTAGRAISAAELTLTTGNLVIGTAGKGIDFSATTSGSGTMTSELLADYEEGTWTPIVGGAGGESGQTYGYQSATYTKVGDSVTARFDVRVAAKGTITGNVVIKGLPFVVSGSGYGTISYFANMAANILS